MEITNSFTRLFAAYRGEDYDAEGIDSLRKTAGSLSLGGLLFGAAGVVSVVAALVRAATTGIFPLFGLLMGVLCTLACREVMVLGGNVNKMCAELPKPSATATLVDRAERKLKNNGATFAEEIARTSL